MQNAKPSNEVHRFLKKIFSTQLSATSTYELLYTEENSVYSVRLHSNVIPYIGVPLAFRYSSLVEPGAKNRKTAGSYKVKGDTRRKNKMISFAVFALRNI